MQKPIAMSVEDSKEIVRLSKESGFQLLLTLI